MSDKKSVLKSLKDDEIAYVDLRFCDPKGKLQHVTVVADLVDEDFLDEGFMFDGSSIAGWKSIEKSDMKLMADPTSAYVDPFFAEKTLCLHCSVLEPDTNEPYERDPRGTALKAEAFLKQTGIGDTFYCGPEAEFFIFDDVRFSNVPNKVSFQIDAMDAAWNTDTVYEMGNMGHRAGVKGGYFPLPPVDAAQDIRGEMLSTMKRMGMKVDKHHHEVASPQHELGIIFGSLTAAGRQHPEVQVRRSSRSPPPTARPRPSCPSPTTATTARACTSTCRSSRAASRSSPATSTPTSPSEALWFIGGILKHAKTINAFTNPTTNSYKRLIPGFEAPVLLAYSARNRSASIRIPWSESPKAKRVEARFPDPCANPYLAFAALLMAGIDGIRNKIDPGAAADKDLYDLPPEELAEIPTVCGSCARR